MLITHSKLLPKIKKDITEQESLFSKLQTTKDVADLLEVPYKQLLYILYKQDDSKKYETFSIPKKMGGMRIISKPKGSISILQSKLLPLITSKYTAKSCVHGFVKGKSILTNAGAHKITQHTKILNIDIKDFYDSINFGRVRGLMMSHPFNMGNKAATVVAQILCWKNKLSQGACTSPVISNMILHRLDSKLTKLCEDLKSVYYTRYADDITISSNCPVFPETIATWDPKTKEVRLNQDFENIFKRENFNINYSKVRLKSNKEGQEITGLTVNEFPNVRRVFIRQIKAMIHAWNKFGLEAAAKEYIEKYDRKKFNAENSNVVDYFKNVVYGKLAYLYMVRGKEGADRICQRFAERILNIDDEVPNFIKNMKESKYDIFLSHASEDKCIAERIYKECTSNNINAFFDKECIKVGDSIPERINDALRTSKIFVIIASYMYSEKKWTCEELWSAVNKTIETGEIRIYPIVIGDINEFKRNYPLLGHRKAMRWENNESEIVKDLENFLRVQENEVK